MSLRNKKGQLSIFMVLIFQIIFVLFAMTLNISLVIYDKINLQNAVDLSAYYIAQKQAEVLNVIASQNYQIRQSWKLLSFRYRVLGTLGLSQITHPSTARAGNFREEPFSAIPTACLINTQWGSDSGQQLCQTVDFTLPTIPRFRLVARTSYVALFGAINESQLKNFGSDCRRAAHYNWYYMAQILSSFRLDQRNRRQVIHAMARNLEAQDFIELEGTPVSVGAQKTFEKNLSERNKSDPEKNFEIFNSLSQHGQTEEKDRQWLRVIKIDPLVLFSWIKGGSTSGGRNCSTDILINDLSTRDDIRSALLNSSDLRGLGINNATTIKTLLDLSGSQMEHDFYDFSLGVEKNPWFSVYAGVSAEIQSRPIFTPFGSQSITLKARGFAKPFGGRIGPWVSSAWPQNSPESQGGDETQPVFKARSQKEEIENQTDVTAKAELAQVFMPNFSRFPGDTLGLRSQKALSDFKILKPLLNLGHYRFFTFDTKSGFANDVLASQDQNTQTPLDEINESLARRLEILAIRPNLFDIYYYSVFANFGQSYLQKMNENRTALGLDGIVLRGDLISRDHLSFENVLSIKDQFRPIYSTHPTASDHPPLLQNSTYFISPQGRPWSSFLTSWSSSRLEEYSTPSDENFMNCDEPEIEDDPATFSLKHSIPGLTLPHACIGKARTGYSVKFVSKDFLNSQNHKLGGSDGANGELINSPRNWPEQ